MILSVWKNIPSKQQRKAWCFPNYICSYLLRRKNHLILRGYNFISCLKSLMLLSCRRDRRNWKTWERRMKLLLMIFPTLKHQLTMVNRVRVLRCVSVYSYASLTIIACHKQVSIFVFKKSYAMLSDSINKYFIFDMLRLDESQSIGSVKSIFSSKKGKFHPQIRWVSITKVSTQKKTSRRKERK